MTSQWTHDTKYVYQQYIREPQTLKPRNIVLISGGTSVKTFMPKEFGWQKGLGNPDLGHEYQTYRPHQGVQSGWFAEKYWNEMTLNKPQVGYILHICMIY